MAHNRVDLIVEQKKPEITTTTTTINNNNNNNVMNDLGSELVLVENEYFSVDISSKDSAKK